MKAQGVVKRGSKWSFYVEMQRDPLTGKRQKKWFSGFRTQKDAVRARIEVISNINNNDFIMPSNQTLGEFIEHWLEAKEGCYKPTTFAVMSRHMRNHVTTYIGNVKLKDLNTPTLNNLYKQLFDSGHKQRDQGLSAATVRHVHTALSRALKDAVQWDLLKSNPAANALLPKSFDATRSPAEDVWTSEELRTFLTNSKAESDRYFPLWAFIALTGVRRGEALAITWEDLDYKNKTCHIRRSLTCADHKMIMQTPKTASSQRHISIPVEVISILKQERNRQNRNRLICGSGWRNVENLVFTHDDGSLLHPEYVSTEFERRSLRYGTRRSTIHKLRHGYATYALQNNISPKIVQVQLGHSSISTTLNRYSHVDTGHTASAARIVADLIFKEVN